MADFAQNLLGIASEVAGSPVDATKAIQQGANLAQTVEGIQNARAQLEQQKQQVQLQKVNAVMDTLKIASGSKDAKLKNFLLKSVFPSKVKALGLESFFNPESLQMLQTSEAAQQKVLGLQLDFDQKIRKGEMTGVEALRKAQAILSDPEELAMLDTDQLFEAQKFAASEEGKSLRNQELARAQAQRQQTEIASTGDKAYAQDISKEYAKYKAGGGKASIESSLARLNSVANDLDSGIIQTGTISTKIPGLSSEAAQAVIDQKRSAAKVNAQAALNNVLKTTLGATFTENEGIRILNQIWDDKQPSSENAKRLKLKIAELTADVKNKEDEFIKQGRMKPEERTNFQIFSPTDAQKAQFQKLKPEERPKALEGLAKRFKMTVDEVKKALGE